MKQNRWLGLVIISMAVSIVIIDGTIVNTIFPAIIEDLALSSTQVQWVQESYVLVFAALLLIWGSLADQIGRRRLLLIGIVIFVIASVWAGQTTSGDQMILARVVQGIGGSMVLPTTLALVNATFQGKERGIAFGIWGATIGGMVAVGPVLGGWLATDFSWRWAFLINLPIGIVIALGLLLFVPESKSDQVRGLDIVGALLSVVLFASLVFGLIEGRIYGWWDQNPDKQFELFGQVWPSDWISVIPVALVIAVLSTWAFIWWELKRAKMQKPVILDLGLFGITSFRNGSIAALIISMGEFGLLFAIPLWLQNVLGLSPISSGLVLLWLAGGAFLASGLTGALSGKLSPTRAVQIGVLLELVGVAGVGIFASPETGWLPLAPLLFIYGIGVGLATAQLTGVIMVDVPNEQSGQASGSQSTVRQVGSALGIAVLGTMLFSGTELTLRQELQGLELDRSQQVLIVDQVVESSGGAIAGLGAQLEPELGSELSGQIEKAANDAFTQGAKWSAWAATGFLILGFFSTLKLGRSSARKDPERQPVVE